MMVICYPPTLIEALQGYQLLKQMLKPTIQIAGFIFLTRRFVGLLLVIDCLVSWKQPMLWSFDSLMPVCACCHAGKSGGFGRLSTIETNAQTNYSNSRLYLLKQAGFQELGRREGAEEERESRSKRK
jgi:hypothetical protein